MKFKAIIIEFDSQSNEKRQQEIKAHTQKVLDDNIDAFIENSGWNNFQIEYYIDGKKIE